MKRLLKSVAFVAVATITIGMCYLSAVVGEARESSKVGQISKRGEDDAKGVEGQPSGSSQNSHTTVHKQSKLSSVRESPKLWGHETCKNLSQPDVNCSDLDATCIDCKFNEKCKYGHNVTVRCEKKERVVCKDATIFTRTMICQYCYQTPLYQQECNGLKGCNSINAPRQVFKHNCTVLPGVLCLGNRKFQRMMPCNWKNGYRWSTSFVLSITLGGFGADRFYLGRWQEGIGKLFSFGGLGLWTIIDIILIGVRYLGPADGSLYVD